MSADLVTLTGRSQDCDAASCRRCQARESNRNTVPHSGKNAHKIPKCRGKQCSQQHREITGNSSLTENTVNFRIT